MSQDRTPSPAARAVPRAVKILGERNTGTNYLQQLVARNLDVRCLPGGFPRVLRRGFPRSEQVRDLYFRLTRHRNLGWKHALPPDASELARVRSARGAPILFLTLTKNPYAWLVSLYRRPYHAGERVETFEEFLRTPWSPVGRENVRTPFANPVALWNVKNAAYLALAERAVAVSCRYEDLLAEPLRLLEELHETYGLARRRTPFENVVESTKGRDRGKTFADYREQYLNEHWREALDRECIHWINAQLDRELVRRFGYAIIEA